MKKSKLKYNGQTIKYKKYIFIQLVDSGLDVKLMGGADC